MTPITLYEGCFVKTRNGRVLGPLVRHQAPFSNDEKPFISPRSALKFRVDGRELSGIVRRWTNDFASRCDDDAIAVYPSLSAAAAANPGL